MGCAGLASAWFAPNAVMWYEEMVQTSQTSTTTVNLIKDSGFDNADFTKVFDAEPYLYGEWLTYKDAKETNVTSYDIVDDQERGKVGSFTGKPYSWYTSFFAQRIETVAKKGIYKLSFWGKSTDGGKAKVFIRLTDANGKDVQKFFIKETGKPADPSSKWYGSYYNTSLTSTWAEYSVEFDFTKTIGSMYSVPLSDAVDADETDLTNFSICFQGDVADKTILIDDVQLELVEDLSEPDPETPTELI